MKKENKIKTWWKRTSTGTKLITTLPLLVIVPFVVYGIIDGFPLAGWISGGIISLGILGLATWANIKDYKNNV